MKKQARGGPCSGPSRPIPITNELPESITLHNVGTTPGSTVEIRITDVPPAGFFRYAEVESEGLHEVTGSRIWVKRDMSPRRIRRTLIHEIMHALLASEEILGEANISPEKEEIVCERAEIFFDDFMSRPEIRALWAKASK